MKKVAIIGTVGIPSRYGGFETLAHQLAKHLGFTFNITVYCSRGAYKKKERVKYINGVKLVYIPLSANGVQSVLYDFISIIHALFVADTLLILGVSGGIIVPFVRLFTNKKIIVNIDGLEWRREKWNPLAKAFLLFSEKIAVRWSHADITDNAAIKRYTSINYKTLSNLIEYGGDHVLNVKFESKDLKKYSFLNTFYAFKVARIEPENNIQLVLEGYVKTTQTLVIVGNWNKSTYGKRLKLIYSNFKNIFLLDAIYNQRELDVLRSNCNIYIHGHSAGGTNPSLVEAMSLNLPIISFDCSYNKATTCNEGIYFKNANDLFKIIKKLDYETLINLGNKMKTIADERYTWKIISNKYENLINKVCVPYKKQNLKSKLSKLDENILLDLGLSHLKNTTPYYK